MSFHGKGKGAKSPYGDHIWLDISILGAEHIHKNLRDVYDICKIFNGIDVTKQWAPVRPMQHYSMGGIRTNYKGESQLKGLFAAGEVACWDLHGFNRLGGNSVSEAVVAGMIVGDYLREYCEKQELKIQTSTIEKAIKAQQDYIESLINANGKENIFEIKTKMTEIMDANVGIFRDGEHLQAAVKGLAELYKKSKNIRISNKNLHNNPELEEAYRVNKMLKLALCVAQGALNRTESRGAHTREDYPKRDDKDWLKRTLASWEKPDDDMPTISYEDLDVKTMEIPPAYRGYGAKGNIIEHPDTAARQAEVDNITATMQKEGKDRYAIQEALMKFDLQPQYKARNQRLGDTK